MATKGECYFCHKTVDDDYLCHGCHQYVCDECDKSCGLFGEHDVAGHGMYDEDRFDDDWGEE